jgi:aryl-alcohol dehydrogenase-like predicted oxidoreductase
MVNTVELPGTNIRSSAIGFGCASLGSRISKGGGLRALVSAFESGVTWFDVAPAYGGGEAEAILGEFSRGRRSAMLLCTKVGRAPPVRSGFLKAGVFVARPLVRVVGGLRRKSRRLRMTRNEPILLSAKVIRTSIERSLIRLNTDYIDVFALHEPAVDALTRDEILGALQDIVREGKARYAAVAGTYDAARAALAFPSVYAVLQLADNPLTSPLTKLRVAAGRPLALISHSVLGVDGALDRIVASLSRHPDDRILLREAGYAGTDREVVAKLLIDRALASNFEGVVLASMFSQKHQTINITRASIPPNPHALTLVERLVRNRVQIDG